MDIDSTVNGASLHVVDPLVAKALTNGFKDSRLSGCVITGIGALPCMCPSTVQVVEGVGRRTSDQHLPFGGGVEGQDTVVVFKEGDGLGCRAVAILSKLLGTELGIQPLFSIVGLLKKSQFELDGQYPPYRFVDATHGHFPLFYELLEQPGKIEVHRNHGHVHSRINGHLNGFLIRCGHFMAGLKVADILPVGQGDAFKTQLVAQKALKQVFVDVYRDAVHFSRVDHDRQGP